MSSRLVRLSFGATTPIGKTFPYQQVDHLLARTPFHLEGCPKMTMGNFSRFVLQVIFCGVPLKELLINPHVRSSVSLL